MERFIKRHLPMFQLGGGIMATVISLTVYAYTNFATKEDLKSKADNIYEKHLLVIQSIERRLDRIETKQDMLNDKLLRN